MELDKDKNPDTVPINWNYIANSGYPTDENEEYLVLSASSLGYSREICSFGTNLKTRDNDFEHDKGFYTIDPEYGYIEMDEAIAWCRMPSFPSDEVGT